MLSCLVRSEGAGLRREVQGAGPDVQADGRVSDLRVREPSGDGGPAGRLGHEVGVIRGGDMEKKERVRILNEFKEGKIKVLICTDLLSRGIDILDVTLVVNFDIPKKGENMVGERGGGEV